jgi:DNA-3-methyladenine glycosylase II
MATTFRITPQGDFTLDASIDFLAGFAPADYRHNGIGGGADEDGADLRAADAERVLRLAFGTDRGGVGVGVRQRDPSVVLAEVGTADGAPLSDADGATVRAQVARILSLDVDARGMAQAVSGDEHVTDLLARWPGLRPVCFNSPYEAACWAILSQRVRMTQAASVRTRIAREIGTVHEVAGVAVAAFPTPAVLLSATEVPGVSQVKAERLHAVARAALDGRLDAAQLRSLEPERAIEALCAIAGVGPFSAELILVRGAGQPDHFPANEPRLHRAMSQVYDIPADDICALQRVAQAWRPYRSWVSFFFRRAAEAQRSGALSTTSRHDTQHLV